MSRGRYHLDGDGDVDVTVPQPVYEFISEPKLMSWSQASLVKWSSEREHYLTRIAERCAVTGESVEGIAVSVKSSCSVEILSILARCELKKEVSYIVDLELTALFEERCGKLKNAHVPDIQLFFKQRLCMNMMEDDSDARILQCFSDFNQIVKDNGFAAILGTGSSTIPLKKRMKQRCKLILEGIQPEMLKVEIKRMIDAGYQEVMSDDVLFYELLRERAALQQHHHTMSQEFRNQNGRNEGKRPAGRLKRNELSRTPATKEAKSEPPRTGCWVCRGSHWLRDCPAATVAQKEEAATKMRDLRGSRKDRVKRVVVGAPAGGRQLTARINDLLDVPFCPDSGADSNMIPLHFVTELQELSSNVPTRTLPSPTTVEFADGRRAQCTTEATVNLTITTAAGFVNVREVICLVLDGPGDEFLLGRATLKALGIDIERMFEQLAVAPNNEDTPDDLPEEPSLGVDSNEDLGILLMVMVDDAIANGFPIDRRIELTQLVQEFRDCWRIKISPDDAARLEPLRVQLCDGAVPFRCKPRRYPPLQSQFLRDYTQQLEANVLIRQNNQSRWACAVVPVKKPGTKDGFRITTDYRPLNRRTIPIAGTTPNLSVVTSSVKALLVWIDDVIVYASNATDFLIALRKFFGILREFNLKLNAAKSQLFQTQVRWCGKLISGDSVQHDPSRVSALQDLPLPSTGADLQYFLCASN
ncbi:hypothetical protein FI667_g5111, partial [Globisporangium splendens]